MLSSRGRRTWTDITLSFVADRWYSMADRHRLAARRRRLVAERPFDRVSIPIATYDRIEVLVDRTIPALLAQSHENIEIIIVGDGTPKPLWRSIEQLQDPRIRSRRLRSRTRYPDDPLSLWMVAGWRARNLGAQMATGNWILWMSDDDILLERSIEALLDVARRDPEVELVSGEQQAGIVHPRRTTLKNTDHGLPLRVIGMPLLCRSTLVAFRWNRLSWRKAWNRPSDLDLLERMGRRKVRMDVSNELVVIQPEVAGTGLVGSKGAIAEELRRRSGGQTSPNET